MQTFLNEIKNICSTYGLISLQKLLKSTENLSVEKNIEIAIFGQFKAGKSSFINSIIGKPILPTGVIPVTSVITKIYYGEQEKAIVKFYDKKIKEIPINNIDEYITESKNPNNIKNVESLSVEIPNLKQFKGLKFIDTPGIGSIFKQNTQTTEEWSKEATIAVVCISAERPLSEIDLKMIKQLDTFSYKQVCMLTKVDLFSQKQLDEIVSFVQSSLKKEINKDIDVYTYSIFKNNEFYKNNFYNKICKPLIESKDNQINTIIHHKLLTIATDCLNYLNIAYKTSLKTDKEKAELKEKIFTEKTNLKYIRQELNLFTKDAKSKVRQRVFNILNKHTQNIISELENKFDKEYDTWKGNLYKFTRKYEQWLKSELSKRLKEIEDKEQAKFNEIQKEINSHFTFYTKSLREKLNENIYSTLGIKLSQEEWKPEFKTLKQPNISIYRTFDSNIDLLWLFFPMFIFKKIFKKKFLKKIRLEVEKNIHRLTSGITEAINKETNKNEEFTLNYIYNELTTIEKVLSGDKSKTNEYEKVISNLTNKISVFKH